MDAGEAGQKVLFLSTKLEFVERHFSHEAPICEALFLDVGCGGEQMFCFKNKSF